MASLADLFLYKKEIEIINPKTKKPLKKVWVRVLGDYDLNKAYKSSRIASANKRKALRDPETDDYKDEVMGVVDLPFEEQLELIKAGRSSGFIAEAQSNVERPDLPELEEIAVDPDAPNLENLEKLDNEEEKTEKLYKDKLQEYVDAKTLELTNTLEQLSKEEVLKMAMYEVSNIVPFSVFMDELNIYKAVFGTFQDKTCKIHEFDTREDYQNLPKEIKDQILSAIVELELSGDDVKN
jgi:hypothetical protein